MELLKKSGEKREINVPSDEVKGYQKRVLELLRPHKAPDFQSFSYCRKGKGPKEAVNDFIEYRDKGFHWVSFLDVKDCFPSIDHSDALELIDSRIRKIKGVEKVEGLPQGHPISPLLANTYLNQFDEKVSSWPSDKCKVLRYMDDIWILTKNEEYAEEKFDEAKEILNNLNLEVRGNIKHIKEGLKVLGFYIDSNSKKPHEDSIQAHRDKIIKLGMKLHQLMISNSSKQEKQEIVQRICQSIQGWRNYYDAPIRPWPLELLLDIVVLQ